MESIRRSMYSDWFVMVGFPSLYVYFVFAHKLDIGLNGSREVIHVCWIDSYEMDLLFVISGNNHFGIGKRSTTNGTD
jgi:hypothetical protein